MSDRKRPLIFLSYNQNDEHDKQKLLTQLRVSVSHYDVDLWSDDRIRAGGNWRREIDEAISKAQLAILLITADYLTSNFILDVEVPKLLERHNNEGMSIFPVIARECAWRKTPWLVGMNVRPLKGKPVWRSGGRYADKELTRIAEEIAELVEADAGKEPEPDDRPELASVPAGVFQMGTRPLDIKYFEERNPNWLKDWYVKGGQRWEQPHHYVNLPSYKISRHPVTNRQYAEFVRATNHAPPSHWADGVCPQELSNHPVTYVSWYDSGGYCRWLSEVTGQSYRLPTEAEWEKAARGVECYRWPWGDEWDASKCNSKDYGAGRTLPATQFGPETRSPYQVCDMAGNVAEWCSTKWGDIWSHPGYAYPYDISDGREGAEGKDLRIIRGGSFRSMAGDVRCAARARYQPDKCLPTIGFRVVCEST